MRRRDSSQLLELLWGSGERPSRGPKPDLSLDRIVQAAIAVAEAEGLEALSMRRVAEQLGFTTMALYRYVPGKAELLAVMLDTAVGEPPRLDEVAGGWRAKLATWARGNWELFQRHPWSLQLVTRRRPMGPNEAAWFEAALQAIAGTGLSEWDMVEVISLVNGYVRGAAQLSLGWAPNEQRAGVTDEQSWTASSPFRKRLVDDDRYPMLRAIAAVGVFDEPDTAGSSDALEFGLQRVLDGIDAFIQARSDQPNPSEQGML
jgi:AcrR family transcriptional regulator